MNFITAAPDRIYNVLFLCPGNGSRSLMAEALLNYAGRGRFWAFSAGSDPRDEADPFAIEALRTAGIPCGGLWPKDWSRFTSSRVPRMDVVVRLSEDISFVKASRLPGRPVTALWSLPDPKALGGSDENKRATYAAALRGIEDRIIMLIRSIRDVVDIDVADFPAFSEEPDGQIAA